MSRFDLAPVISGALEERDAEGRQRAVRGLLVKPVLRAEADGDLFRLARRHADALRELFDRLAGWRLVVEARTVRLLTSYIPEGPTARTVAERHPARVKRGDPGFTRRRYVVLCLTCAVLERSDLQVALGRLAEDIVLLAAGVDGVEYTLGAREERSDLVAVIRLLVSYGVLAKVAGDEDSFTSGAGDALYDVDRRVLASMLSTQHPPAMISATLGEHPTIDRIEAALHEPAAAYTEDEANRQLRHSLVRRLLLDPVVYYDELTEAERGYLVRQRVELTTRITEATGLVAEMRAEGIAMVDSDDALTDLRMPEQGTDGHATLLLAEYLATQGRCEIDDLRQLMKRLARENTTIWRKATREPGAESALVTNALDTMAGLGLVSLDGDGVEPLPALRRFAIAAPTITERKTL